MKARLELLQQLEFMGQSNREKAAVQKKKQKAAQCLPWVFGQTLSRNAQGKNQWGQSDNHNWETELNWDSSINGKYNLFMDKKILYCCQFPKVHLFNWYDTIENIRMSNKHMNRCTLSLVIREMQIISMMRCYHSPIRIVFCKACNSMSCLHILEPHRTPKT